MALPNTAPQFQKADSLQGPDPEAAEASDDDDVAVTMPVQVAPNSFRLIMLAAAPKRNFVGATVAADAKETAAANMDLGA